MNDSTRVAVEHTGVDCAHTHVYMLIIAEGTIACNV